MTLADLPKYRKAVMAACGASVTIAYAFGVPIADDIPSKVVALYDALAAFAVYVVPNE